VAPTTSGWSLALYASLLAGPFCRVPPGPVALFSVRPWGDGLGLRLGFPLTSLWTPLPSIAAPGVALFRLASRLREVRPGSLPLSAGSASLGEVFRLGVWFNALTYFRPYHAL
jgi:hypothetical protein